MLYRAQLRYWIQLNHMPNVPTFTSRPPNTCSPQTLSIHWLTSFFWLSLSLRLSLSPKFGLRPKISQKMKWFFSFGLSNPSAWVQTLVSAINHRLTERKLHITERSLSPKLTWTYWLILHELDKSIRDLVSLSEKSFHFFANPKVNKKTRGCQRVTQWPMLLRSAKLVNIWTKANRPSE